MFKYVVTLVLYAVGLVGIGYATYSVSPPGANAVTALIAPAAGGLFVLVCAVLSAMVHKNRMLGMIGIHVGLVVPLLMAAGPAARISGSLSNASAFNTQLERFHEAANSGVVITSVQSAGEGVRLVSRLESQAGGENVFDVETDGDERAAAWHPAGYQTVGLAASIVLSLFAFCVLLLQRPSPAKRAAVSEPETA